MSDVCAVNLKHGVASCGLVGNARSHNQRAHPMSSPYRQLSASPSQVSHRSLVSNGVARSCLSSLFLFVNSN